MRFSLYFYAMRVNILNPKYLSDQHLIAEYREMKMATYYYVRSKNSKVGIIKSKISERYTLNEGHAYMWYNKMAYIKKRFNALCEEMRFRNFKCDYTELNFSDIDKEAFGDFEPTKEDIKINLERVLVRIAKQPKFYKYRSEEVKDWNAFYHKLYNSNLL